LLSSVIRDFGLTQQKSMRTNLADVQIALDEMVEAQVLLNYKVEKVIDPKKQKILDAMLRLTPHPAFAGETMKANRVESDNKKTMQLAAGK
jgi:hypothetical protein